MSAYSAYLITCVNCGTEYKASFLTSWNYDFGPMPEQTEACCPNCGKIHDSGDKEVAAYPYPKKTMKISHFMRQHCVKERGWFHWAKDTRRQQQQNRRITP